MGHTLPASIFAMQYTTVQGKLTATAESVEDIRALLALQGRTEAKKAVAKQEYKKACALCGKRVKYIQAHTKKMHSTAVPITRVKDGG